MLVNSLSVTHAEMPPIRTWGDLSTTLRDRSFNNNQNHTTDWLTATTINASSYIWHPWFALINGGLSFATNKKDSSEQASTRDEYINGRIQLNLFPGSRFPFLFYANKSHNELDDNILDRTITNTLIGMRQQYGSLDGRQFYNADIKRNKRDDIGQERYINDSLNLSARYQLEENVLDSSIVYDKTSNLNTEDVIDYAITGRHSYEGSKNLTFENIISSSQDNLDFITSSTKTTNNQLSSFASWQPANRSDIYITGNIRISDFTQTLTQVIPGSPDQITQTTRPILNLNQGLVYNYTPRITITESINISQLKTGINNQLNGSESLGIRYMSDMAVSNYGDYSWSAATGINHSHATNTDSKKNISSSLGHSLSKDIFFTPTIKIQSRFNQSLGFKISSTGENTDDLRHSINLEWAEYIGKNSSSIRFLVSDARSQDLTENKFQLLNLQINNDYRVNRFTHLLANLTVQNSIVTSDARVTKTQLGNGQLNFTNNRFLNNRALRFQSIIKFGLKNSNNRNNIILNDGSESENSWENELFYRIGLFEAKLNFDLVKRDDKYNRLIMIRLSRNFGDL